jgi:hypothetical protein
MKRTLGIALFILCLTTSASAATITYVTTLAAEGGVISSGTGSATLTYDDVAHSLRV